MILLGVIHFQLVFGQEAHIANVILITVQELVKGLGLSEFPDLGLVVALAKFPPHGVEHHLGQGVTSGIVLHLVIIQPDSLRRSSCSWTQVRHKGEVSLSPVR